MKKLLMNQEKELKKENYAENLMNGINLIMEKDSLPNKKIYMKLWIKNSENIKISDGIMLKLSMIMMLMMIIKYNLLFTIILYFFS